MGSSFYSLAIVPVLTGNLSKPSQTECMASGADQQAVLGSNSEQDALHFRFGVGRTGGGEGGLTMAKVSKGKKSTSAKAKALPIAQQIMGPTPEQEQQARYIREEIIHAESFTRATVHRIRQASSLRKLFDDRQLTDAQYYAAVEIAHVAEAIERNVAVRCASLESRVDCSGSARNILVERLGYVRMEATYTKWRTSIAVPRRMIVDMVLEDRSLFATARVYRVGWPKAKRMLGNALDHWNDLMERARRDIDQEDLDRAHSRACA